jgi:ring-1,2-phenylacetyl-CoA epoxidase subunit PaaD
VTDSTERRRNWIAEHGTDVPCPYCSSTHTERSAEFGPFHMSEAFVCLDCRSPFSRIKWRAAEPTVPPTTP